MKKAIIFLLGLILLSAITNAQSFTDGSRVISLGVGIGSRAYGSFYGSGSGYKHTPTIVLGYEQALAKKAGPGYLGLGGVLSWRTSSYRYEDRYFLTNEPYHYTYRYTNYTLAARLAYHADELISDEMDIYFGGTAGLRFQTFRYSSNYTGIDNPGFYYENGTSVHEVWGLFAGIRYYLKPSIALMGEVSYGGGVPFLTIGLAFKL